MNKKILMLAPIAALFLASCGDNVNRQVTEDEFKHAISLEGVEFMQVTSTSTMETPQEELNLSQKNKMKMSPGVCYTLQTGKESTGDFYTEIYATPKEGEEETMVSYIIRRAKTGDFEEKEIGMTSPERFLYYSTPQEASLSQQLELVGITYADFEYKNGVYSAEETLTIQSVTTTYSFSFYFANKKLVRTVTSTDTASGAMVMTDDSRLTYNHTVPARPTK